MNNLEVGTASMQYNSHLEDFAYECEFWLNEIIFLGHVIFADGIAVDPEQLKSFLGLAS